MASSCTAYNVSIPADTIPTAETKIKLADKISISPLVLGTWAWGDKTVWSWNDELDAKAKEAFDMSISKGINTFDTAEVYGKGESERSIARYKKDHPNAKDIVIATKFLPYPYKLSYPSSLINALRGSLEKLQVDCVDLYQIHGPIHLRSIEVVADALAEAVKLGLTKTVGVSNYSTGEMIKMYDCLQKHGIQLASNQVEYSILRRTPETSGHIAECHKRGVAVLGYSPLAMGRLTGKYSEANPPPAGRHFSNVNMNELEPLLATMRRLAEKYNVSVSSVALNYVICKGVIPLGGARDGKQAEQNAGALGWRLKNEEITEIESHTFNTIPSFWHRFWQHG
ncbi:unnamed protein product [Rotaria magnacalcarata]|uniref:NADP-dependent oxidoreductase domain-containing protein n=2 Tax=Rotaria magnacalcarata TaxID=392030 RepID=A0A819UA78_9BILA|nr:unnamed protein product [Rotaria magnacalcarata]CAF1578649.1 unnamed protein product [Rotaria magnacalcarata]CAF2160380.1 unnamed protein product [Rotaria magnacalcarata]CAF2206948.1 unnamed protein product [Rotaria magnacalcarata]CAF2214567.1 unnamed protein product [Rotaria magnacalcarata]